MIGGATSPSSRKRRRPHSDGAPPPVAGAGRKRAPGPGSGLALPFRRSLLPLPPLMESSSTAGRGRPGPVEFPAVQPQVSDGGPSSSRRRDALPQSPLPPPPRAAIRVSKSSPPPPPPPPGAPAAEVSLSSQYSVSSEPPNSDSVWSAAGEASGAESEPSVSSAPTGEYGALLRELVDAGVSAGSEDYRAAAIVLAMPVGLCAYTVFVGSKTLQEKLDFFRYCRKMRLFDAP